jgi:hypothetical protein
MSFASITRADWVEPSAPDAVPTPRSCQEQFLLGRKENAQLALQRLHRCNAVYTASMNIEEFTFWYVTLPSKSAPQQNVWFGTIWRNNLGILTAAPISVPKQEATGVLDAGIARGLKRAKREDLGPKWLASHDPVIIAEAISPGVTPQTQHEHAHRSSTPMAQRQPGEAASDKMLAQSPQIDLASTPATYGAVSRPRRVTRGFQTRYAGPNSFRPDWHDVPQHDPLIDELNRAQLQDRPQYAQGGAMYSTSPPQPYIASSGQPASSFASAKIQQPVYPSSFQQQPGFATSPPQEPVYAIPQPQASYASSSQPAAYLLLLPLQIETNVRSILQQIATNVNTLQQAISRQLRGY